MTTQQILAWRDAAYRRHAERWRTIRLYAYPDTGGTAQYIHNWYACSRLPDSECAGIIANSGEWASWHRIQDRLDRWYAQAEHRAHAARGFTDCHWCPYCRPQLYAQRSTSRV